MDYFLQFIVRALAPRRLLQVEPERVITGQKSVERYLKKETWDNLAAKKNKGSSRIPVVVTRYSVVVKSMITLGRSRYQINGSGNDG